MPATATIASVLTFIPISLWKKLKKFVTKDGIIVFDASFKCSTKYTPALLIVMMCLSFANQFVRNIEIDCATSDSGVGGVWGRSAAEMELNTYCWNYETFLVEKALLPEMRNRVTYPGISSYEKGKDELVRQRYYKYVWFGLGKVAVLSFLPLFFWKFRGTNKLKPIVNASPGLNSNEDDARVANFIATIGVNSGFALHYFACKFLATITPLIGWYYLCGFIGQRFEYYGVDVIRTFLDRSDPWPNPMDVLFPKIAKCEWAKYGMSGDREVKAAQCQLPMNNLTQWSFFIFWWWLAFVLIFNLLSFMELIFWCFPRCRASRYRNILGVMCQEDIENILVQTNSNGKRSYRSLLKINLNFNEWLILNFLQINLKDLQFKSFIRRLAVSENRVIQIKFPVRKTDEDSPAENSSYYHQNIQSTTANVNPVSKYSDQIGFRDSILRSCSTDGFAPACVNSNSNSNSNFIVSTNHSVPIPETPIQSSSSSFTISPEPSSNPVPDTNQHISKNPKEAAHKPNSFFNSCSRIFSPSRQRKKIRGRGRQQEV